MSNIQVFDNFLENNYFNELKTLLIFNSNFPWYYGKVLIEKEDLNNYQFTHSFYYHFSPTSDFFGILKPCLEKLNAYSLIKIKSNLIPRHEKIIEHGMHIDNPKYTGEQNIKTAILYMNTNNGYTLFEDGRKVESIENRMILFNSNLKHTGTTCTDKNIRVVINFNFF